MNVVLVGFEVLVVQDLTLDANGAVLIDRDGNVWCNVLGLALAVLDLEIDIAGNGTGLLEDLPQAPGVDALVNHWNIRRNDGFPAWGELIKFLILGLEAEFVALHVEKHWVICFAKALKRCREQHLAIGGNDYVAEVGNLHECLSRFIGGSKHPSYLYHVRLAKFAALERWNARWTNRIQRWRVCRWCRGGESFGDFGEVLERLFVVPKGKCAVSRNLDDHFFFQRNARTNSVSNLLRVCLGVEVVLGAQFSQIRFCIGCHPSCIPLQRNQLCSFFFQFSIVGRCRNGIVQFFEKIGLHLPQSLRVGGLFLLHGFRRRDFLGRNVRGFCLALLLCGWRGII